MRFDMTGSQRLFTRFYYNVTVYQVSAALAPRGNKQARRDARRLSPARKLTR